MKEKQWSRLLGTGVLLVAMLLAGVSVLLKQEQPSEASSAKAPHAHLRSRYTGGMIQTDPIPGQEWRTGTMVTKSRPSPLDAVKVYQAQGLRDEYFSRMRIWKQGGPAPALSDPSQEQARHAQRAWARDRLLIEASVAKWYLSQAFTRFNPSERRAFLHGGEDRLIVIGEPWYRLVAVPASLNRDSLLARYDELLMPGGDEQPPWERENTNPQRDEVIAQYRAELVARGLVSAAEGK